MQLVHWQTISMHIRIPACVVRSFIIMDYPDYVQQYGLDLDFDNFTAITHYADYLDDGNIPEVNECDTVATCSVMLRTRFIKESDIGIMPEDNFIYWDDMEWCYRFHLAGYKVVTIKDSVVLTKWVPMRNQSIRLSIIICGATGFISS